MTTTIITALYDIGRGEMKGDSSYRPFSLYLEWFKNLLQFNAPMVVFVDQSLGSYVKEHRPENYQTKVVIRKFQELKSHKYYDRIQHAINIMIQREDTKELRHFKHCPEFVTPNYQIIQYSKLDFLLEVSQENPFNTEYFTWLDAGTYQNTPVFDVSLPWPDPYKMKIIGDKFLISERTLDVNDKSPLENKREYLYEHNNQVWGYIQLGKKETIKKIHTRFFKEVEFLLEQDLTTNDQIIYQLIILENPQDFYLWHQTRFNYKDVKEPELDRMVPCELARGTFIQEDYPVFRDLKVLTVSTKEISSKKREKWERTAKHFGYNYEILGTDQKWTGWKGRTKLYVERLKSVKEKYVLLMDSNDIFFCGSSQELMDKFLSSKQDLIIGGEVNFYYVNGNFPENEVKKELDKLKQSPHAYPNGGCIIGKTSEILKLKQSHLNHEDDQAACFETIFSNKTKSIGPKLVIDYETKLIGNIPKVPGVETNRFEFDAKLKRYKSIDSGEYPCILHFSGSNYKVLEEFYNNTIHQNKLTIAQILELPTENTDKDNNIWLIILIVFLLVFFGIVFVVY